MQKPARIAIISFVGILTIFTGIIYGDDQFPIPYSEAGYSAEVSTGSEVSYTSGTYHFAETDLRVSARSIPMAWERTYRSNRVLKKDKLWVFGEPADGPLGFGWMTPWFMRIEGDAYVNGEGRYLYFEKDANGNYLPQMKAGLVLKKTLTGFELQKRGENTYIFNTSGKLTVIKDPNGNTAVLTYDAENRLTSIKDIMGRTIFTFTYNTNNRISQVTDIAGRTISYEYDAIGNLTKVSTTLNSEPQTLNSYTYNSYHGLISKGNALGETYTVEYQYPDRGIVRKITDPVGNEMTFTYDFKNRVFYYTDYRGVTYKNITDTESQVLSVEEIIGGVATPIKKVENLGNRTYKTTDALGNATIIQKDEWGNVKKRIDPEGNEWRYTYNIQGKPLTITDPTGTITKYEYDTNGYLTKIIQSAGKTEEVSTFIAFDSFGELTRKTIGDAITTINYNSVGLPKSATDPLRNTTLLEYDAIGNLTAITDPNNNKTEFTYDQRGNKLTMKDPLGNITTYGYNSANRLTKIIDALGNITLYETDFKGRITTITDVLNNRKEYRYDGNGNLIKITEGSSITTMTYESLNRITSLTDAEGNVTRYEYAGTGCPTCGNSGSLNNPIKMIDSLGDVAQYIYDKAGRLTGARDRNGNFITYSYDAFGRLIKETYPDGTNVTYTYDAIGKLLKTTNANTTLTFTYDQFGNGTSFKDSRLNKTVTYTYDLNGNRTIMTDPEGGITRYTYDKRNSLTSLINSLGKAFNFIYDANGRINALTYLDGVTATYIYDPASQLTEIINKLNTNLITKNAYAYDSVGNRLTNTDIKGTHSYQYDSTYQLIQATHPNIETEAFTYDKVGNRVTETRGQTSISYTHTAGNRIETRDEETYVHDKNGNIISVTTAQGTTTYEYNYDNMLKKATMPDGTVAEYKYDPFGRRIEKAVTANNTTTTTRYLYDGWDILAEYDENNSIKTRYTHSIGIDDPLAMERDGNTYYYHKDVLGSITAITDNSGNIVQNYEYDAFGNITAIRDKNFKQPYAFTGREYDEETGLYFYRARYYDARIGRFISEDPIGLKGGDVNFFAYIHNQPINWVDPLGLFCIQIWSTTTGYQFDIYRTEWRLLGSQVIRQGISGWCMWGKYEIGWMKRYLKIYYLCCENCGCYIKTEEKTDYNKHERLIATKTTGMKWFPLGPYHMWRYECIHPDDWWY